VKPLCHGHLVRVDRRLLGDTWCFSVPDTEKKPKKTTTEVAMPTKKTPSAQQATDRKEARKLMNRLGEFLFGDEKISDSELASIAVSLDRLMPDLKPVQWTGEAAEKPKPQPITRTIIDKRGDAAAYRAQQQTPWGVEHG